VDRNVDALQSLPAMSWRKFALALVGSIATMIVVSLWITTFPTEGYRAGYEAAITKGPEWVDAQVDSAGGGALRACEALHPRGGRGHGVDYGDFVNGCSAGVDHLAGRHIPVLAAH
jgi:hypothetical protein